MSVTGFQINLSERLTRVLLSYKDIMIVFINKGKEIYRKKGKNYE